MSRQYVDNAYNRSIGRVGMTVGTAVVSKSSGGGASYQSPSSNGYGYSNSSTSNYYSGNSSYNSSPNVYADNAMNRGLGRVGMAHGTAVHSKSSNNSTSYKSYSSNTGSTSDSPKVYIDDTINRNLGRVCLPHGSAVHSRSDYGSDSHNSSSSKVYVDNALNRNLGRVGLPHGTAVHSKSNQSSYSSFSSYVDNALNRRLERVGFEKGTAIYSKAERPMSSTPKRYVDNSYNRQLGRVGLPIGSAVQSKSHSTHPDLITNTYVDNALNRRLGRVGKKLGKMPGNDAQSKYPRTFDLNLNSYPNENENLRLILDRLEGIQREEIQNLTCLKQARKDNVPKPNRLELKSEQVILFEELHLDNKIGGGGFGDVYVALWKGYQVAVKKLRVQRVSQLRKKQFEDEVRSIANVNHPNIVKFYGASIVPPNLAIVMEFLPDGSLYDNLYYSVVQFDEETKNQLICDAFSALVYVHSKNMVHRDIKSRNILLCNDRSHCKLADFGLALKDDVETNSTIRDHGFAGTEKYCPKEVIDGQRLTVNQLKYVDVYSLAITTVELLTEVQPYDGFNIHQIRKAIRDGETPTMHGYGISSLKKRLLKRALSENVVNRPTARDFLKKFADIVAIEFN